MIWIGQFVRQKYHMDWTEIEHGSAEMKVRGLTDCLETWYCEEN